MYLRIPLLILLTTGPALAQQADPAFLQRAITAIQAQRNLALDAQAVAEARVAMQTEELTKAQARIKELEDKATTERRNQ